MQPISLYIDLEKGQKADLETVSRAAEAFAAAIREISFVLDPSLEIRIELIDGTESSLSLNSLIKALKDGHPADLTLRAIAYAVVIWFTTHALDWGFNKFMDMIAEPNGSAVHLTQKDKEEIAGMVAKAIQGKVGQPHIQRVYRELESDKAVRGVGAANVHHQKPLSIVPRDQFAIQAGYSVRVESAIRRHRTTVERLVLVRAVLKPGQRRWQFASREGEFGARIKDQAGLHTLLSGTIPMREGIELDAELETVEERRGSIWVPVERNLLHVQRILPPPVQTKFEFTSSDLQARRVDKQYDSPKRTSVFEIPFRPDTLKDKNGKEE